MVLFKCCIYGSIKVINQSLIFEKYRQDPVCFDLCTFWLHMEVTEVNDIEKDCILTQTQVLGPFTVKMILFYTTSKNIYEKHSRFIPHWPNLRYSNIEIL